jgi:hypothetical protein
MCQPGYRYPPYQNGPFKGELIEKATKEEYSKNFDCIPVDCKFLEFIKNLKRNKI